MMHQFRHATAAIGALAALMLLMIESANSQAEFPTKPLRVVVPYPPGGSTDVMTRAVIDVASRFLRQPVIVENKAGGGTVVGTQAARFAPADGYTLLFQGTALITNVLSLKQPGYELRDFTPVAILAETKVVLMSPLKPHLSTVRDLVSFAKANPGTLNYAILGRGTASHIMGHRFGRSARFNWVEIPYKGAVEASNAILSGESDALFASQFAAQALAESGKAKLLAVASSTRVKSLPDVPTFAELGYPDMDDEGSVFVIYVRSETPPAIVEKLRDAFGRAAKSDEFAARRDNQGLSEYTGTIDDFNAQFKASTARLANEFKELSITPQ